MLAVCPSLLPPALRTSAVPDTEMSVYVVVCVPGTVDVINTGVCRTLVVIGSVVCVRHSGCDWRCGVCRAQWL